MDESFFYAREAWQDYTPEDLERILEDDIKLKHVRQALENLSRRYGNDGPFEIDEFNSEVQLILVDEALQGLVKAGVVEMYLDESGEFVFGLKK